MTAKTFEEWWSNYDAVIGRETCCRDAWNAATEAAVKRFTSTNKASAPCCSPRYHVLLRADGSDHCDHCGIAL